MNILKSKIPTTQVANGGLVFDILPTGDIFRITSGDNYINLLQGNLIDGGFSNVYLRRLVQSKYEYAKLIGIESSSRFAILDNRVIYHGNAFGIVYQVVLTVIQNTWHYDILIKQSSDANQTFDIFYGQDLGIASKWSVLNSEAYTGQYIDHKAFKDDHGFTICSRQNQGESLISQIGSITPNVAYSTDGFQFYGLSSKENGRPLALGQKNLPSFNYQYEFPFIALQSEPFVLSKNHVVSFYGYYEPNHPALLNEPIKFTEPYEPVKEFIDIEIKPQIKHKVDPRNLLNGSTLSSFMLDQFYPKRRQVEMKDGKTLSFFIHNHRHVVLKEKELLSERPTGHLLVHGDLLHVSEKVMATTQYMYGVFNSHVVLGNTNFHKLLGDVRNPLNLQKISGQRIYVSINGTYRLLNMPSAYEMGANFGKWIYVIEGDILEVTVFAGFENLQERLVFKSQKQKTYDIIVSHQLAMGEMEYAHDIPLEIEKNQVTVFPTNNAMIMNAYPKLKYRFISQEDAIIGDDSILINDANVYSGMMTFSYHDVPSFTLDILGTLDDNFAPIENLSLKAEETKTMSFIDSLAGITVEHATRVPELSKLTDIVFWYTHNALVHYASPHGLEQYNGAAWGTRDVCQGPIELFMSAQRFDLVREILLKVFSRQFIETGDFPQWFMFDRYFWIQAQDSHGDIIVWPLRCLAYYLKATGDLSIIDEAVSFMSKTNNNFTEEKYTIREHVRKILSAIQSTYIKNTSLPSYGGGDWDDTLQPANHDLTYRMVSGWTVALLYESLNTLVPEIKTADTGLYASALSMRDAVRADYQKYLIKDGVPTGFVIFNDDGTREYLLHPSDEKTGLKYRLLPFNRGMISELFMPEDIERFEQIIAQHLKHPDGVRLMDTAVTYRGGIKTYFSRAETAANFGREIGIQYVHAHIRYIEAMAKIGDENNAYEGLFTVNPILIQNVVPNAGIRQSNMYFSSSDAAFNDRYQAKKNFELVRQGKITVKGGWRLYSSGPGIYINQLISHVFGIRLIHGNLHLDPVLIKELDGLKLTYHFNGYPLVITYRYGAKPKIMVNGKVVEKELQRNRYRTAGFIIEKKELSDSKTNQIEIWSK